MTFAYKECVIYGLYVEHTLFFMINHPLIEQGDKEASSSPCIMVIFGATGDLTARKLMPALYNLERTGELPDHFLCVGFARREWNDEIFREKMRDAVSSFSRKKPIDPALWDTFSQKLHFHRSPFDADEGYIALKKTLQALDATYGTKGNRLFYLSTPASYFPQIIKQLHRHALLLPPQKGYPWSRVIIEKPFGHDFSSAKALQKDLLQYLKEEQIYRIDHYLGKETVQNLLVLRFGNAIFESLWNSRYIDHVQITVAEDMGIGTRGKFYEESGSLRDVVQNHMMQLLSLVAMEPPTSLEGESIRNEKAKVLECLRPLKNTPLEHYAVRGQYKRGFIDQKETLAYREEEFVSPTSNVETYTALKLYIDNWRWHNVPFYLRGGKRLPKRATEIAITFKAPPSILFQKGVTPLPTNVLAIRIQPNEGISLKMHSKVPGPNTLIQPVHMDFRYGSFFGFSPPEAYERLLCDALSGDNTLFAREEEVFLSWHLLSPLIEQWENSPLEPSSYYEGGTWGPTCADTLIERDGRSWRLV